MRNTLPPLQSNSSWAAIKNYCCGQISFFCVLATDVHQNIPERRSNFLAALENQSFKTSRFNCSRWRVPRDAIDTANQRPKEETATDSRANANQRVRPK